MPPASLLGSRAAFAVLRSTYAATSPATRWHAYGRFFTCPLLPLLGAIPRGARLLDLGAGHGTFARLALAVGAAAAVAVEPDAHKVLATFRHPRVRFVAGYAECVAGTFDVVALIDVLYRIPLARWDDLLAQARARLRPGGLLLLKEIDPAALWKGRWNRAQERLADLLGLTLGEAFSYETPAQMRARLERLGFAWEATRDLGRGYPHAHVLYVARRAD